MKRLKLFVLAGEASGDRIGAELMQQIEQISELPPEYMGVGGAAMQACGLTSIYPMQDLTVHGLLDAAKSIPLVMRRLKQTVAAAVKFQPDAVITIDAQDFSAMLMRRLARLMPNSRRIHLIAPTVWATRPYRAKNLAGFLDYLITIFPFEPPLFEQHGLACTYIGHPAVARARSFIGSGKGFRKKHSIDSKAPLIFLAPGSRRSEIRRHMPILGELVRILQQSLPKITFVIPCLPELVPQIEGACRNWPVRPILLGLEAKSDRQAEQIKFAAADAADLALVASGTITAEICALGKPMVVFYHTDWLVGLIVPLISSLKYVSVPNIVAGREIVPEFLQSQMRAKKMAQAVQALLSDPNLRKRQIDELASVVSALTVTEEPCNKQVKIAQATPPMTPMSIAARRIVRLLS